MFSAPRPSRPVTTCSWRRRSTSRGLRAAAGPSSRSARTRCFRRGWWSPRSTGIQAHPVQATIKHFIANNQEYRRFTVDVRVDERTLHEIYLPPFEAAIREGSVAAAMASFNRVNGAYVSEHPGLLSDILRGELGFRGLVMSDYEATWSTAAAANAGLDQEQPSGRFWVQSPRQGRDRWRR